MQNSKDDNIKKKINILLLLPESYGGGAENLVLDYFKEINKKLFNTYIITLRKGNIINKFRNVCNEKYICLNTKSKISPRGILKLIKFIKKKEISIVHTNLVEADFYGFLMKIFYPKIILISTRHGENDFRKILIWRFFNFILSLFNKKVICVSKSLKRFIRKYEFIPENKCELIHNGINVNYFDKDEYPDLKKNLSTSESNYFLIGIVGRLIKIKGHFYLFKAIKELKNKGFENILLLVIGIGSLLEDLKKLRKDLKLENNIKFLHYQDEIKRFYNAIDLLCLPSDYEGLSLVLMEAMACQTLVLCSNIPNNLEIVEHGINGLIFNKGEIKDLSKKLKKILKKEYNIENLKKAARWTIIRNFNINQSVEKLQNIYLTSLLK